MIVGAASGGSGKIAINGGTFTTGTGVTLVNPTGVIDVNGGVFVDLGITTNSGSILVEAR